MQLSDVLKDTNSTTEVINKMRFNEHLERLSKLPDWKKREFEKQVYGKELTLTEVRDIIGTIEDL